ncbi:F0F1 ATP synthase subunit B [Wolinella succinogenes]|uniref:ATP synthase subunit b n=1 Tax=Wolinella succinogenes (strain ATCC 29543 / DSM 1740 / CCUG 13145 / JCM 31913 / LMG 7466 / NCTC 11488 / FDC 602W) TaxID=273121 RepID=ATPF_WOLSU|nr:F0F1 ATP synthase subunit B [Wolinella succinogenes]Q7MA22.1 RecName: Full=ATP synthase subunit b; AltName: Full=ATP synthase F(0) sector subunit b; AltName: Full=ATPase subunit I; AltName: Full=F-type ATPase subunit b; Short=F-ATPase subunit b [Wolinella succinogenes DSM 1740]HCZ19270.1 ATP synthase subunit B [Helicobacter sp.]NLU34013.1 F0F1 ATP synthase subunit B [Wolinella succinogenes]CAE09649.1 ATP SYNTHASE F0 SECTOR B SUBUNIT [Wolinella succinogenes]VEG81864.1 F0F1 ATP synthase subun
MKGKYFIPCLLLPTMMLASGGGGETDIVERTINFVIFIAIFYYLAADKIKAIFVARQESIAAELEKVQEKLKESKKAKEQAQKRFEESKRMAEDVILTAKKEVVLLTQKVEDSTKGDIENLIRQYNDSMEFEKRKAERAIIDEILAELFESDATKLDKSAYSEILLKKVA